MALDLSQKAWLVLTQPPEVEPQVQELPVRDKELTHTCPRFLIPPESGPAEATAKTSVEPESRPEKWVAFIPLDNTAGVVLVGTRRIPETLSPHICLLTVFCNPSDREATEAAPIQDRTRLQAVRLPS